MKAKPLCIPEKALEQHLVVLGKTGSGKSSALRHIVEHLLEQKKRVTIVDMKGDWWGLKSSADGTKAGVPILAFGSFREPEATDVPINAHSGRQLAELITSGNRPCIIGFRGWMPHDVTDFWLDFAPTLFNKNEGEHYIVISECHNFAPKGKVLDPKAGKVLHWTNRLLSEGRGLGMTFLLDSQRPQKVHNDTLTCCETLVAMRVIHAADRDAIEAWIDGCGDPKIGKGVLATVAGMARGEAWVWSPEAGFGPERVKFPMFTTFDSFAPAQLQKKVSTAGWSTVNLDDVREKMAAAIERAKLDDPRELRKQVADLGARLVEAQRLQAPPVIVEAPKQQIQTAVEKLREQMQRQYALEHSKAYKAVQQKLREIKKTMGDFRSGFQTIIDDGAESLKEADTVVAQLESLLALPVLAALEVPDDPKAYFVGQDKQLHSVSGGGSTMRVGTPLMPSVLRVPPGGFKTAGELKKAVDRRNDYAVPTREASREELKRDYPDRLPAGETKVLAAVASFDGGIDKDSLSVITGYKARTRNDYIFRLKAKGYVEERDGTVTATLVGIAALGNDYEPPKFGKALRDEVMSRLPEGERKILEFLIGVGLDGNAQVVRAYLDEVTGYKPRTRNDYLYRLAARKLVVAEGDTVRAADRLF